MQLPKSLKTPLRYPGGKSRATKFLFEDSNLPDFISEYMEPFLGGGSCAIAFSRKFPDVPIWVNDKYYNLYAFWITLQKEGQRLSDKLSQVKSDAMKRDSHKELFIDCKNTIEAQTDLFEIAWRFYVCNKCSFSGLGESSGFSSLASISNFSERGIKNLIEYSSFIKNWKITNLDYVDMLKQVTPSTFLFLDPPYDINSFLYGKNGGHHSDFMHNDFRNEVKKAKCNTMITYNSNDKLKSWYGDWRLLEWDLTYTMHSGKSYRKNEGSKKELLIRNYTNISTLEKAMCGD